jgi:hypothetical protein
MEPASELRTSLKTPGQHDNRHRRTRFQKDRGDFMAEFIRSPQLLSFAQLWEVFLVITQETGILYLLAKFSFFSPYGLFLDHLGPCLLYRF